MSRRSSTSARGPTCYISEWAWDDSNVDHMAEHAVAPADIEAVWSGEPKFRRNKRDRAASHQMIGPGGGGRRIAAFILEADASEGRWCVITARVATGAESKWWELS